MKSSLYGGRSTRQRSPEELEEQIRSENEALIDGLSTTVVKMKNTASGFRKDVKEHNEFLQRLSETFNRAQGGLGSSVSRVKNVMQHYGYKDIVLYSLVVLAVFYIFYKILV